MNASLAGLFGALPLEDATTATVAAILSTLTPSSCYKWPRNNVSQWFDDGVLTPFESAVCDTPLVSTINATHYAIVDRSSGTAASFESLCLPSVRQYFYKFLATFYRATGRVQQTKELVGLFNGSEDIMVICTLLLLFCTPIAIGVTLFALLIIRNVLVQADSYLYVYHAVLAVANIFLYVMGVLQSNGLLAFLFLPGCLASQPIAVFFSTYVTTFSNILIMSLFTFVSLVQALLAMDRVCAAYLLMLYQAHASASTATKLLLVAFALNFLLMLYESSVLSVHIAAVLNLTTAFLGTPLSASLEPFRIVGLCIRFSLMMVSLVTQIVCCTLITLKLRRLKKHPLLTPAGYKEINLLPCLLLAGTCGINILGGTVVAMNFGLTVLHAFVKATPITQTVATSILKAQWITIPLSSSLALFVHCMVSPLYRDEVFKTLKSFGKIASPFRRTRANGVVGAAVLQPEKQREQQRTIH